MKIRQAKKILHSKHWARYCQRLRPLYFDKERGVWVQPSWHDIPNKTFQKARRKFFNTEIRFYNRHGYGFGEKINKR